MAKLIKNIYAQALFDEGIAGGITDSLYEEAGVLYEAVKANPELVDFLANPGISSTVKEGAVEKMFKGRLSDTMSGFIMTVVNKGRHKELSDILLHYMELVKEFKHIGTVYVTTPMELSQSEKDMIHSRLLNTTDYVSLEMNYDIDPSLIGGMVVRIGDRICDSSIKTKLSAIHKELSTVMLNQ